MPERHGRARTSVLVRAVARALIARGYTLATAESLTGGSIAAACTAFPGSSDWFECAFVTYRTRSKTALLGLTADRLATNGVVSEATVRAMAEGALARCEANLAIAVTGVAGPGRDETAPVGTVWIAWAERDTEGGTTMRTSFHTLSGSRRQIRNEVVRLALEGLLRDATN